MRIRAVIFDDDTGIRSAISAIFKSRGYEVIGFSDVRHCPVLLRQDCPCPEGYTCADIMLTDVHMPGMTGLEFLENQLSHGCMVPNLAAISGYWTEALQAKARGLGCRVFNKPFSFAEFQEWLDECERRLDPDRKLWDWFIEKREDTER